MLRSRLTEVEGRGESEFLKLESFRRLGIEGVWGAGGLDVLQIEFRDRVRDHAELRLGWLMSNFGPLRFHAARIKFQAIFPSASLAPSPLPCRG